MHHTPLHSIPIGFPSWKRYSVNLFFIILLSGVFCACGSGLSLTHPWCDSEQFRNDNYYSNRASGAKFSSAFYNSWDSLVISLPKADSKIIAPIYRSVQSFRSGDSSNQFHAIFYTHAKDMIDAGFAVVKGVAK